MELRNLFYNRQTILPLIVFVIILITFYSFKEGLSGRLDLSTTRANVFMFLFLYLGAQMIAAIIDIANGRFSFSIKNFFSLWASYLWMTLIHLLLLLLAIPLLIFLFLMGPVAFIGGLIAIATIFIFFVQEILGFQMVAHPPDSLLVLYALLFILFFIGLYTLVLRRTSGANHFMDKFIGFFIKHMYTPAERLNRGLLELMDV